MKPIRPVIQPEGAPGYPSLPEAALSRRGFLGCLLALGGAAIGGPLVGAAGRQAWLKATVPLTPPYRFASCGDRQAERVVLQTTSKALHRFLGAASERAGLSLIFHQVLHRHGCKDLDDQQRLRRLELALGRAAATRYWERTRKRAAPPLATLVVGRRPVALDGLMRAPSTPVLPRCR